MRIRVLAHCSTTNFVFLPQYSKLDPTFSKARSSQKKGQTLTFLHLFVIRIHLVLECYYFLQRDIKYGPRSIPTTRLQIKTSSTLVELITLKSAGRIW